MLELKKKGFPSQANRVIVIDEMDKFGDSLNNSIADLLDMADADRSTSLERMLDFNLDVPAPHTVFIGIANKSLKGVRPGYTSISRGGTIATPFTTYSGDSSSGLAALADRMHMIPFPALSRHKKVLLAVDILKE